MSVTITMLNQSTILLHLNKRDTKDNFDNIKPRIEKMTKPAKTEVPQLMNETSKASL